MQHDALFVAMRAGNQRLLGIDWKIALASKRSVARLAPTVSKKSKLHPQRHKRAARRAYLQNLQIA
ncbi:Unknown protein sequence [Pseudomonas syringae pv. berberidis]|uniref:Uncharacterized protein n=1 Tax=Pseudomonas syringae pv. persicae TaxID=237306 RepID=A0AB38EN42_9PSED|nr:Unknown protein sequence [Pseudomonas syringae pv. berberidis]RMP63793.1 hypothetical protein ALQ19_01150 [Pseudomonas syringae pv. berberidis]SOQ14292.1 hypothetical protein CFBP1573P_04948 [Pseudomonas syringae pv. persicae]SOQ14368.1 hypothetical protein NCPPB2254_04909 [Pseudomonas syringae pv. persicae]